VFKILQDGPETESVLCELANCVGLYHVGAHCRPRPTCCETQPVINSLDMAPPVGVIMNDDVVNLNVSRTIKCALT